MSKVIRRLNIRVEVQVVPAPFYRMDDVEQRETRLINEAWQVVREINRHVDDVESAHVTWDTVDMCTDCGLTWETITAKDATESEPVGTPVCCNKAMSEFLMEVAK